MPSCDAERRLRLRLRPATIVVQQRLPSCVHGLSREMILAATLGQPPDPVHACAATFPVRP